MAKRSKVADFGAALNGNSHLSSLPKALTGIKGLDEISGGGLPRGRTTIVCGGPGCGKTMLGMEFLIHGAQDFDEPGVLVAFEETPQEMERNVASLGFDVKDLVERKKLFLDYVYVEPSEIQETGRLRSRGPVHSSPARGEFRRCKTHLPGYAGGPVLRLSQRGGSARGIAPPVSLAEGAKPDHRDHGGKRRKFASIRATASEEYVSDLRRFSWTIASGIKFPRGACAS